MGPLCCPWSFTFAFQPGGGSDSGSEGRPDKPHSCLINTVGEGERKLSSMALVLPAQDLLWDSSGAQLRCLPCPGSL